jgi:tetratricopeptide (TPR) repeat protein
MIAWLLSQSITTATSMGIKIMEREYHNIAKAVNLMTEDLTNYLQLSLQMLYCRDILSIIVDKRILLKWYLSIRDEANKQMLHNTPQYINLYATLLNELGNLSAAVQESQLAGKYLNEVLEMSKKSPTLLEAKAEAFVILGKLNADINQSMDYFNKSLDIGTTSNKQTIQALANEQIGLASLYHNKNEAVAWFQKTLDIHSSLGAEYECMRQTMFIGAAESATKQYPIAKVKYELALNLARGLGDINMELEIYHHLANVYKNLADYSKAITYFELCLTYRRLPIYYLVLSTYLNKIVITRTMKDIFFQS